MKKAASHPRKLRVGIPVFDGVNGIDVFGPLEAFATARLDGSEQCPYDVALVGASTRAVTTEVGARVLPRCSVARAPSFDTLIVPGGRGLREPQVNAFWSKWLLAHAPRARRIATVCTGIYGLAPTGLLDGLRVTTHWRHAKDVAARYPRLVVEEQALFVRQGRYYSCGGVTSGIDLALALIEEDLGPRAALAVAREMIVYLKRPGGQAQFSEPLRFQTRAANRFADLVAWASANLHEDLSVEALADRVCLSPRQFSRRFNVEFACTPAEFIENLRMQQAQDHLLSTSHSIDAIAASLGFGSADVFRRRFALRYGISPRGYRERFATTAARHS
ncbi:MAG TPA: helix-turn-helix domain-containing protein [Rudaea sp.]|nr:helix-turn-helix domain-containing protein [Rudaea sp.]